MVFDDQKEIDESWYKRWTDIQGDRQTNGTVQRQRERETSSIIVDRCILNEILDIVRLAFSIYPCIQYPPPPPSPFLRTLSSSCWWGLDPQIQMDGWMDRRTRGHWRHTCRCSCITKGQLVTTNGHVPISEQESEDVLDWTGVGQGHLILLDRMADHWHSSMPANALSEVRIQTIGRPVA